MLSRCWRNHSLTIVNGTLGTLSTLWAFQHDEGRWFDLWLGFGIGFLTVAAFYCSAGFLTEKNKPET